MQKTLVWRSQKEEGITFRRGCADKHGDRKLVIEKPYIKIGDEALKNNIRIKEVVLADCIKEIGQESFSRCTRLRNVNARKIRVIRNRAFSDSVNLRNFQIPKTVEYLGKGTFSGCKRLQQAVFEENSNIFRIPVETFTECEELSEIIIPGHVEEIERRAFYKCVNMEEIEIPQSVKKIEREAFYQTGITELKLPENLSFIGESAFLKCKSLEYVRIPEGVETVEKWAFHGCNRLKTVEFSGDPQIIGDWIINRGTQVLCKKGTRIDAYCKKNGFEVKYF